MYLTEDYLPKTLISHGGKLAEAFRIGLLSLQLPTPLQWEMTLILKI